MNKREIKQLRRKFKMSQQQFATSLGVSVATVSRWETGKTKASGLANEQLNRLEKQSEEIK